MPAAKKRVYKRRKPAAARRRRAGPTRSINPRHQVATVVETLDPQLSFLDNVAINQAVSLSIFPRCVAMARLYEQFRIEEVKFTYSPLFNLYQETLAASSSVPIFYNVMDRLCSLNSATTGLSDITQMGAQRRPFTKPITIKYRPNTMITTGVAQPAAPMQTLQINGADYGRWFPCVTQLIGFAGANTPNTLSATQQNYNGHWVYVEQILTAAAQPACNVSITVRVSFKNPMINQPGSVDDVIVPWTCKTGPRETPTYTSVG